MHWFVAGSLSTLLFCSVLAVSCTRTNKNSNSESHNSFNTAAENSNAAKTNVEELGLLIFLHPFGTSLVGRMSDHYFPNTIGHPLDSALCVGQLIFDGYLERFPKLKVCIAHGGGYLPAYWGRLDHAFSHREDCRVNISKPPSEYLKKLYFDTVVFDPRELRHLIEIWGADHIMLGTDYPFDMAEPDPVGFLGRVKGVSKAEMALVAGGNAARLLGLPANARSRA